jgi:predicted RND superfamily exporter protein
MNNYFKAIDRFAAELTQKVIAHRRLVLALALMLALGAGFGASKLEFSTNYRVFFSDANPELPRTARPSRPKRSMQSND